MGILDCSISSRWSGIVPVTILERIAAGDPSALDECMDRYGGLIWSLVRRLAPDYTDAEDIVQEILVGLWRSAGRFDPRIASEATFITMIARRRLIDRQAPSGSRARHGLDWKRIPVGVR